ncbi:MAG: lambda-exonuclease family protein [Acidiferrobacterales bacterium]
MKIVDIRQRTPEWFVWRTGGITASDVPTIVGASPYSTPWRLWSEKKGRLIPRDPSKNPWVRKGQQFEDAARQWAEQTFQETGPLLPVCVESDDNPILRASLDGIDNDGCPVEIKVPSPSVFQTVKALMEQSPAYKVYRYQVLHQILVTGGRRGRLVFYDPDAKVGIPFEITRDAASIDNVRDKALEFWGWLQNDQEPEKDKARDIFTPSDEQRDEWAKIAYTVQQLDAQRRELASRVAAIDKDLDGFKETLVGMMGEFAFAEAMGLRVTRFGVKGAIDYRQALDKFAPGTSDGLLEVFRKPLREQVRMVPLKDGQAKRLDLEEEIEALRNLETSFYF